MFVLPLLPEGAERTFPKVGEVIVYKEAHPESGPWLDRSVKRRIDDIDVRYHRWRESLTIIRIDLPSDTR